MPKQLPLSVIAASTRCSSGANRRRQAARFSVLPNHFTGICHPSKRNIPRTALPTCCALLEPGYLICLDGACRFGICKIITLSASHGYYVTQSPGSSIGTGFQHCPQPCLEGRPRDLSRGPI